MHVTDWWPYKHHTAPFGKKMLSALKSLPLLLQLRLNLQISITKLEKVCYLASLV